MTDIELKDMITENYKQIAEVWAMFKETDKKIDKLTAQSSHTDKQLAQTDKKIDKLTGKWGRFVEYFLAPGVPKAFQDKGIDIHCTMQRLKKPAMEIDILGLNNDCLVIVEVKSTLSKEDVDHLLEQLPKFRDIFPEFFQSSAAKTVYAAVAGIEIHEQADRYAFQKGLFVLTQKGDTVKIDNPDNFKPKTW